MIGFGHKINVGLLTEKHSYFGDDQTSHALSVKYTFVFIIILMVPCIAQGHFCLSLANFDAGSWELDNLLTLIKLM